MNCCNNANNLIDFGYILHRDVGLNIVNEITSKSIQPNYAPVSQIKVVFLHFAPEANTFDTSTADLTILMRPTHFLLILRFFL